MVSKNRAHQRQPHADQVGSRWVLEKFIASAISECGLLVACLLFACWQLWRAKQAESDHLRKTNEKLLARLAGTDTEGD